MDTVAFVGSAKKIGRAVPVQGSRAQSGVGTEIAVRIMKQAFDYLDELVARVSGNDVPMPYDANLERLVLLSVIEVVEAANAVRYR